MFDTSDNSKETSEHLAEFETREAKDRTGEPALPIWRILVLVLAAILVGICLLIGFTDQQLGMTRAAEQAMNLIGPQGLSGAASLLMAG